MVAVVRSGARAGWQARLMLVVAALVAVSVAGSSAAKPPPPPPPPLPSAGASVSGGPAFVDDKSGTVFTFTVENTGAVPIGGVEISRPSGKWKIDDCLQLPAGWNADRHDDKCRFKSQKDTADDIPAGQTATFSLRVETKDEKADLTGAWEVVVARADKFDKANSAPAAPQGAGLSAIAHSFEILDAVVATDPAAPGSPCPPSSKQAIGGMTVTIVVCGENRTKEKLTPTAAESSLGGTFIGSVGGPFTSGLIDEHSANVVLGNWASVQVAAAKGTGKTIVTRTGASASETSPLTTLGGYEVTNQAPTAAPASTTTLEDTPTTLPLSGSDADGDSLTFALSTAAAKGTTSITGLTCDGLTPSTCTATLNYTPLADENGVDDFAYTADDGFSVSAAAALSVAITPVNDEPSFSLPASPDQLTDEDSGAQVVNALATSVKAGPANESGQTVTFHVSNDNNGLFSAQPSIDATTGNLTYTPAADANGSALVSVYLTDDGGTANGGDDTSPTQTFQITVAAVNDAPSFTKGADQLVLEDAGAQVVPAWATGISPGPADESGQTVSFVVTGNTNPALFAAGPAVATDGTLSYTPAADANGSAMITLKAVDDGAPPAESATQSFQITVTPVNDAPSFDTLAADPPAVNEDATAQTVPGFATGMSAGPPDESVQALHFAVVSVSNPSLFFPISGLPLVDAATGDLTYMPALDANGTALVTIKLVDDGGTANGGVDESAQQSFTITVNAVNDAPSFQLPASPDQLVLEDSGTAGAHTVSGFATLMSAGPPDESGQTLTFQVLNDDNGLFSVQPDIDESSGDLTYTLAPDANGSATVSVSLSDDGGTANGGSDTSGTQTFAIEVTPVNDAPSFDLPASPDQSVVQDSGPQTVGGFATNISAGPADESGQTLTFHVSNTDNALFATQPAIDPGSGDLTYESAGGATGSAIVSVFLSDDGGTADGGDDTSATQTFQITIRLPNATPVAESQAGGNAVSAIEDTVEQITLSATDDDGDALTFAIVGGPGKGTLGNFGTVNCAGSPSTCTQTVDYTPAADANGPDSFTFKANDGQIDSNVATVEIDVASVNDAPSFVKGADESVLEDSGAHSVTGWATAISAGPADESIQTVTFEVTNNTNAALFSVGPAVSTGGDLTYTPAADAFGSATVTLRAHDDGGTANGGVDVSPTQTFQIDVAGVNDAPSFTKGANQTFDEDSGAHTIAGWATGISAGPANESGQNVSFVVTDNTNPGLFSSGPAVSPTGALSFTSAANQHGTATITLKITDDGGTANGGVNESATQSFTITINAVNDPPTSPGRAYGASSLQANMQRSIDAAGGLLVGAADANDVAGNAGWTPTFTVGMVNGVAPTAGTITTTVAGVGTVVANAATGAFTIDPAAGVTGNVSFNFTVCDNGEGTPASQCSATATASFNIAGPVIWFVNPAAGTNGAGTLASPFNVLSSADAVDAANHRVFVYSGTTTTGLTLNSGEWLIGQPATGPFDTLFAITPPAGTIARPTLGIGATTIGGTVTLATNAKVQGVAISTGTSPGLAGSGGITGVSVSESSITTTTGTALDLNNAAGAYTLSGVSTNGAANGILLDTLGTTNVTVNGGTIVNASTRGVDINGGTGNFIYTGSITTTAAGRSVEVTNHTGGTVAFSGSVGDSGLGINLATNTGGTINFTGGLVASTGSNTAFNATGGGTVNVDNTSVVNTLTTTTATALNVANTTIGSTGLRFRSITAGTAASGPATGIILNATGAGGLTVTGNGGTCSSAASCTGGAIQKTTGPAVNLTSTGPVSLTNVDVETSADDGIRGSGVGGFALTTSRVVNNGDAVTERGVEMTNLTGTATVTSSNVSGNAEDNFWVLNDRGLLTMTVTGSTFSNTSTAIGNDGFHFQGNASGANPAAQMTLSITGSTFNHNRGDHFQATTDATSNAVMNVTFNNNTLTGDRGTTYGGTDLGASVTINTAGTSDLTFDIENNGTGAIPWTGSVSSAISINSSNSAILHGTINNNVIGSAATIDSGSSQGDGFSIFANGSSAIRALVTSNTISQYANLAGIHILQRDGSATVQAVVRGNTIANGGTFAGEGVFVSAGTVAGDSGTMCLDLGGAGALANSFAGSGKNGAGDFRVRQRFNTTVRLPGYGGTNQDTTAVVSYLQSRNSGPPLGSATVPAPFTGGGFIGGGACTAP